MATVVVVVVVVVVVMAMMVVTTAVTGADTMAVAVIADRGAVAGSAEHMSR